MKSTSFSMAAIFSSLIASLCCIGPVVAALLGIGTFGFLTALETFRPYLTILSIALIGAAFYLSYRMRKKCADGSCETVRRPSIRGVWIGSILVVGLLAFPYLSFSQDPVVIPKAAVISVKGMTCAGCEKLVESVVGKLDGVSAVHASASEGKINVVIDSTKISLPSIITTLDRETPYKASIPNP
jgi:copper chaperone CopZ